MANLGPDSYRIPEQQLPPAQPPPSAWHLAPPGAAPPGTVPAYAPPGSPARRQRAWDTWEWQWAVIGGTVLAGLIALAVVVALARSPGRAAPAARAAPRPLVPLPSLTAGPAAKFSPAQLQALLPAAGTGIPAAYRQVNPGMTLKGLPFPLAPQALSCTDLHDFFGELAPDDANYAAVSSETASDSSLDTMSVVIMEADSLSWAQKDMAAMRDASSRCPTTSSSVGTWRVAARAVPGLGDDSIDIRETATTPGPDRTRNGPQDILLVRQGSDLVEVDYQLSGPPGPAQSGLGPSVLPPSAWIIRSILARL